MYCVRPITSDILYVGASDRRQTLFENIYPIPRGISYNAYLVLDEKTVLMDTADHAVSDRFFENIAHGLNGRQLDYVVVDHMEPDHTATLGEVLRRYPACQVVGNAKTQTMIGQFFDLDVSDRFLCVKEGDVLSTGRHAFTFYMAPMVHWPEVMVTYDQTDKVMFSADAFGTFGALSGNLFADELDFEKDWMDEARRYYTNIVGKYGVQVQALLKKMAEVEICTLCPLHGPIWRKDISRFMEKYRIWSSFLPEERGVVIACGSIYGNTENAADYLAFRLAEKGVRDIVLYDLSHVPVSEVVSQAFRFSHLVLASSTYNGGIFTPMEELLLDLKAHNLQNRTVAMVENGSWAAVTARLMGDIVGAMKNMTVLEGSVSLRSSVKADKLAGLDALADALAADILSGQ